LFVSHFNTFLSGGAATAAQRLHHTLSRHGVKSHFQYLRGEAPSADDEDRSQIETRWRRGGLLAETQNRIRFRVQRQRFKRALRRDRAGQEIFTAPQANVRTCWPPVNPASESSPTDGRLVHLHWVSKLIDWTSFFGSLPDDQPIVWTLHDMNPITGGCHFSEGCQRFRSGCGNCPQLRLASPNDISAKNFEIKRRALAGKNLHVVAPSRWLIRLAKTSPILAEANSFTRIPYGIPVDRLYPIDRDSVRHELGIQPGQFVFCFGAMDLANRRKGSKQLIAALAEVGSLPNAVCLVFGSGRLDVPSVPAASLIHVGHLGDDATRRKVYSAADVFVLPSLEDNLPLTGLEAMACGTPVVGFDAGGISDYVLPEQTGLLAKTGDVKELGQRLLQAARHPETMRELGRRGRQRVLQEFASDVEANRYLQLYQSLTAAAIEHRRAA